MAKPKDKKGKDGGSTIALNKRARYDYLTKAETAKTLGAPVAVKGFTRLALGEGVEKKQDDFAAEVASMTGQA